MQAQTTNISADSGSNAAGQGDASSPDVHLIERRQQVRPLPIPHVVERNDDEVWEIWSRAVAST